MQEIIEKTKEIIENIDFQSFFFFLKQLAGAALFAWWFTSNTIIQNLIENLSAKSIYVRVFSEVLQCEKCIVFVMMLVFLLLNMAFANVFILAILSAFLMNDREKIIGKWQ